MFDEIFSREISRAQSKYEIVEKNVTQQSSYNLDLKLMYKLLELEVIKHTDSNHFEINDNYNIELGDGILSIIGYGYQYVKLGVIFIYTESIDGTKKFQIKRKENCHGAYEWFLKLYDKNYEGSKFKIYLDTDRHIIKFDVIAPVDIDGYEFELKDVSGIDKTPEYLSSKLTEYYDEHSSKPSGVYLFGIDFCEIFERNDELINALLDISKIGKRYKNELLDGILIGLELRKRKDIYLKEEDDDKHCSLAGFNKIYYGIPGCGKSYKVSAMLDFKKGFQEEAKKNGITSKVNPDNIFRTTFYLDYSNSDFVGQIYPVVSDTGEVTYEPVPGPFTNALVRAYTHPNEMIYLVIEEINRGNAAAIFGDLFQLLDRVKDDEFGKHKGESEYPISNEFIESYLKKILSGKILVDGDLSRLQSLSKHNIIIPNNLTIFATMNTSDQNVFPLDTAFKRRWNLERVKVDWSKNIDGNYNLPILNKCIPFTDMTWGNFASSINIKMIKNSKDGVITQDKNLGPFFVSEDLLVDKEDRYNPIHEDKLIQFTNNVIDYLFLDVTKFDHDVLFEKGLEYDVLYEGFTSLSAVQNTEEAKIYLKMFANNIQDDIHDNVNKVGDSNNGDTE